MKKIFTLFIALVMIKASSIAQVNFENLTLIGTSYWKGTTGVPGDYSFSSGIASFALRNDTSAFGDYWSGWAYSKLKDSMSLVYATNDCAAFPAMGHNNSDNYAVAYQAFDPYYNHIRFATKTLVNGFYISNSTIAYRSMQNGYMGAKKFGGLSGNDPDYFRIRVTGWNNGIALPDSITFYLADFTDSTNANDYIVNDWQWVNTSTLGLVDSLTYTLESTDTGAFGMNTPAYFCIDDMQVTPLGVEEQVSNDILSCYPLPFRDQLYFHNHGKQDLEIGMFSANGQFIQRMELLSFEQKSISTNGLAPGSYFLKIRTDGQLYYKKLVK